jgi:magnesium transporter
MSDKFDIYGQYMSCYIYKGMPQLKGLSMDRSLLQEIRDNIDVVAHQSSPLGISLWNLLLEVHPADMADFFADIPRAHFAKLFNVLPKRLKIEVFKELSDRLKVYILSSIDEADAHAILHDLQADELTDLFDFLSDDELRKYLNLLSSSARKRVLTLMKFHPESAGGIMDLNVFTLMKDFTVEKSIKILQRLKPDRDIYQRVYITDHDFRLQGYIELQDLVLQAPQQRIADFMKKSELVAFAEQDQEEIAHQMVHYSLTNVPVVGSDSTFLGVIPADTLADVLVEEAGEDVQRISAMAPLKQAYFDTPVLRLVYQRAGILIVLLLFGSISGLILDSYQVALAQVLFLFVPMIISTGGNTSSQTSAVAIQGMAAGDVRPSNMLKFLRRELSIGFIIGGLLGATAFLRVFLTTHSYSYGIAIGFALGIIVLISVTLGSCVPLILKRFNIDPAYSAGPFLATIMDIFGTFIYCYVCWLVLG